MLRKPGPEDFPVFQKKYIDLCPADIIPFLEEQKKGFTELIESLDSAVLNYRYAKDKWSLREVIMHIIDTEQIFSYRAMAIARGEKQVFPGFDQDEYIRNSDFGNLDQHFLSELFNAVREYSLLLFKSIRKDEWNARASIDDYKMTLLAIPYMHGGHLQHHWNVIDERYLAK